MKNILLAFLFIGSGMLYAQEEFNEYKYIIVPKRFDNFKKENQHQTSTLVKYLLIQKGLPVIYDDALPRELGNNRCLALVVSMNEESSLFSTKLTLIFKDCNAREIYATEKGISKKKEFKAAYAEAIREATASMDNIEYKFSGKKEMKRIPGQLITETIEENTTSGRQGKVIKQTATIEEQSYKNQEPVSLNEDAVKIDSNGVLYAQEITHGYQLVDSTPKIRMKILKSSITGVYLAEQNAIKGLVYKKNDSWFFEYYAQGKLMIETLNIKF